MYPSRERRFAFHSLLFASALIILGCGTSSSGNNPGVPRLVGPSPDPSIPQQPQWSATVSSAAIPNLGTISVSSAGDLSVSLAGAPASTAFSLQFCQFPQADFIAQLRNACFLVEAVNTDANGAAQTTIHFPQRGTWAGHFFFTTDATQATDTLSTDRAALTGNFSAQLVPMNVANGGIMSDLTSLQEPLSSGSVTVSQQTFTLSINGAAANRSFNVSQCPNADTAACINVFTFTTETTGAATITAPVQPASDGSLFRVIATTQTTGGFISGFIVP